MRGRLVLTVIVAVLLIAGTLAWALHRRGQADPGSPEVSGPSPSGGAAPLTLAGGRLLIRDPTTSRLAVIDAAGQRHPTRLACNRAYAAGGRVLCLGPDPESPTTSRLSVLDSSFSLLQSLPLVGLPTRTRVSADGRMLAFTVFVSGDSYLSSGFSTRTGIWDLATGLRTNTLEDFTVDGRKPPLDANFWGVSFAADDNTFYATMSTGRKLLLVRGDFAAESMTVIDTGIECPSLSPDGTRLVYKKRLPDLSWRLGVYVLATKQRIPLTESGNVDDQAAWLDNRTIAYAKVDPESGRINVWSVPADGSGTPQLLAPDAESPSPLPGP